MGAGQLTSQQLQDLRDLAAQGGKILARRTFGDGGPPLDADLFTLEQAAQAAAQGLLQGTLATLLAQQAQAWPDPQPCPACQHLGPLQHEPRPLDCRGVGQLRGTGLLLPGLPPGFFSLGGPACA